MTAPLVDRHGMAFKVSDEGHSYYVTPCCGADAKGSGNSATGVCCRACYAPVSAALGGVPEPVELAVELIWTHRDGLVAFRPAEMGW